MSIEIENLVEDILDELKNDYHSELESFKNYSERNKIVMLNEISQLITDVQNGYKVITNKLNIKDIDNYLFTEQRISILDDEELVYERLNNGENYQNLLNYSDEMMATMYNAIIDLYETKQYEDCIQAVKFLIFLNPYVSIFWGTLGNFLVAVNQTENALKAYEMSIATDYTNLERYEIAADFCNTIKNHEEERNIWELALVVASSEGISSIKDEANKHLIKLNKNL